MNNWLLVGHRSELRNPGDFIRLPHAMGDIVAYNDEGKVRVIVGVCPHRGTQIFNAVHGNQMATCRYHGWTFRNGKMKIPNAQAYPVLGPGAQMQTYFHEWIGDWLFASRHNPAHHPIEEEFGGLRQFLMDIGDMIGGRLNVQVMAIKAERDVCIENALEDHHIAQVHPTTFAPMKMKRLDQYRMAASSMAVYDIEDKRTMKMLALMGKHMEYPTGSRYFHLFLAPCAAISSVGGLTFSVQHYLPTPANHTLFITRLYKGRMKATAPDLTAFYDSATEFNATVFHEDAVICESIVGRGHALASPEEDRIRWFRESV
jgi:phenylpropionate dioxygenase-like ring-hydroxylating dioxygenase large terminal subunit